MSGLSGGIVSYNGSVPAITSGAISSRPASGFVAGDWYLATDTQILYRWDGSAWQQELSNGGGGVPNIEQVLAAGNTVADGNQLIFTNGAGFVNTIDQGIIVIQDTGGGWSFACDPQELQITDPQNVSIYRADSAVVNDGNNNTAAMFVPGDLTARSAVTDGVGNTLQMIADGNVNACYVKYFNGAHNMSWTYSFSAPLTVDTSYNWRETGNSEEVAFLSDIVAGTQDLNSVLGIGNTSNLNIVILSGGSSAIMQSTDFTVVDAANSSLMSSAAFALNEPGGANNSMAINGGGATNAAGHNTYYFANGSVATGTAAIGVSTSGSTSLQMTASQATNGVTIDASDNSGRDFNILINGGVGPFPVTGTSADFRLTGNAEIIAYQSDLTKGTHSDAAYVGSTILITGLTGTPVYATVSATNAAAATILGNGYYLTYGVGNIQIHNVISVVVAVAITLDFEYQV